MSRPHSQSERIKKSFRLHKETVAGIEQSAEKLNLNTSRTVEKLIQWGLQHVNDYTADIDIAIQRVLVEQAVERALGRYLKLLSQTTIAANEAKEMAQQVFFVQLRALGDALYDAEDVDEALTMHRWNPLHEKLFAVYQQRQQRGHERAVEQLGRTIALDEAAWAAVVKWGRGTENVPDASGALVEAAVERVMQRYLELLTQTVLAATEAKEMAQQVFFLQLRRLADELETTVSMGELSSIRAALALDSRDPLHSALYDVYKQRQARGRNRAVRQLKSAIDIEAWQKLHERMEENR